MPVGRCVLRQLTGDCWKELVYSATFPNSISCGDSYGRFSAGVSSMASGLSSDSITFLLLRCPLVSRPTGTDFPEPESSAHNTGPASRQLPVICIAVATARPQTVRQPQGAHVVWTIVARLSPAVNRTAGPRCRLTDRLSITWGKKPQCDLDPGQVSCAILLQRLCYR